MPELTFNPAGKPEHPIVGSIQCDVSFVLLLLDLPGIAVALEMLGKFTFTTGVCLLYVYGAEIYPTVLRTTATGTCGLLSRLGTCLAPFLFNLGEEIFFCCWTEFFSFFSKCAFYSSLWVQVISLSICRILSWVAWLWCLASHRSFCQRPMENLCLRPLKRCRALEGELPKGKKKKNQIKQNQSV